MDYLKYAHHTISTEMRAIEKLDLSLNDTFNQACHLLHHTQGKIIVIGMGKSGHIGHKIAATLASTGSPAFFVHPAEASHGDLGMIGPSDVVLAISNSGSTEEIISILPRIKRLGVCLIAMTGNANSVLAQAANLHLLIPKSEEACPLGLAPTSSTTVTLVLGDALAVALLTAKGFTEQDFAHAHPGGNLGKRLLVSVQDLMTQGTKIPIVQPTDSVAKAILEMSQKSLGMTTICHPAKHLLGIFTDGDLRRAFKVGVDLKTTPVCNMMTNNPLSIQPDHMAVKALQIMQERKITTLVVTDTDQNVEGVIHLHQLLDAGIV